MFWKLIWYHCVISLDFSQSLVVSCNLNNSLNLVNSKIQMTQCFNKILLNKDLAILAILPKCSEIPDFR